MRLYGISNDDGFPLSASNSHFVARVDSAKCFDQESRLQQTPVLGVVSYSESHSLTNRGTRAQETHDPKSDQLPGCLPDGGLALSSSCSFSHKPQAIMPVPPTYSIGLLWASNEIIGLNTL